MLGLRVRRIDQDVRIRHALPFVARENFALASGLMTLDASHQSTIGLLNVQVYIRYDFLVHEVVRQRLHVPSLQLHLRVQDVGLLGQSLMLAAAVHALLVHTLPIHIQTLRRQQLSLRVDRFVVCCVRVRWRLFPAIVQRRYHLVVRSC